MATKAKGKSVSKEVKKSTLSPSQIKKFVSEVKAEFLKIVWPDKKVTLGLTGVVVLLTVVVSIYLGSVDLFLGKVVLSFLR
ncbi:MAG: preprotein translocase subunit SecE [Deltaproteobacteria bacterium]|nr:MAG: preprotein translocase subunit SecE [Desulfobacterales bacterium]PIE72234.1 MAG: preprotein translocase subunit SecE [Deltaproteobacteria bacterium]